MVSDIVILAEKLKLTESATTVFENSIELPGKNSFFFRRKHCVQTRKPEF